METLVNFLFFALAAVGMSHILVESYILQSLKEWIANKGWKKISYLLSCYQCSGFHTGWLLGLILDPCNNLTSHPKNVLMCFLMFLVRLVCYGLMTSVLSTLMAVIISNLNVYREK